MYFYIHIPFCKSKCKYCKFASFSWTWNQIDEYVDFLKKEIREFFLTPGLKKIDSIYFGWWTPSILTIKQIKDIIGEFNINLSPKLCKVRMDEYPEVTLEMNPENVNENYLNWLKEIWINRLSIWIQSLNDKTLSEIWRCDFEIIKKSFDILNKKIIDNVWLDFIIGLPCMKKWELTENIAYILDNYDFVKHTSVYMLEEWIYPKNWQNISIRKEDYLDEYEGVYKTMQEYWFSRYEISNFAKPGFECLHNKSYWNHSNYRWFWLWAASFIENRRFANSSKFSEYYASKMEYQEILNDGQLRIEKIMFDIRTIWVKKEFLNKEKTEEFIKDWFLIEKNVMIKPTFKWIWILDYILSELI